jgi:hypothetical protein
MKKYKITSLIAYIVSSSASDGAELAQTIYWLLSIHVCVDTSANGRADVNEYNQKHSSQH